MMESVTLRSKLRSGDLGRVATLHGELYEPEFGLDLGFEAYVAAGLGEAFLNGEQEGTRLWLAESDGELRGCVGIVGHSDGVAQLRWFLVHPKARGQGLGRRLIAEALAYCREQGYRSVFLWTLSDLTAAIRLYREAGFERTERNTQSVWGPEWVDERYDLRLDGGLAGSG